MPKIKRSNKSLVEDMKRYGIAENSMHGHKELKRSIEKKNENPGMKYTIHPLNHSILKWKVSANVFKLHHQKHQQINPDDLKYVWIDTTADCLALEIFLKKQTIIFIDMECHSLQSYTGIICTIQISTKDNNFIVDALKIPQQVGVRLKRIFEDETILKVVHGGANDVLWLQRDFSIFLYPYIDTQILYSCVKQYQNAIIYSKNIGFKQLVEEFLGYDIPKEQLADFRIRPLHPNLIKYCVNDSKLLLGIWVKFCEKLDLGLSENFLNELSLKMRKAMLNQLYGGRLYPSFEKEVNLQTNNSEIKAIAKEIYVFREYTARKMDVPPKSIMSSDSIKHIAEIGRIPNYLNADVKSAVLNIKEQKKFQILTTKFNGECYRCRNFGHLALNCTGAKVKKCDAERAWYSNHQDNLEIEKKRLREKQRQMKQAIRSSKYQWL